MNNLILSDFESEFFKLNVFRGNYNNTLTATELANQAKQNRADLIRLKIDIIYEAEMNNVLFESKLPFFYSHSVLNVKVDYNRQKPTAYKNEGLVFEKYVNGLGQKERFYTLVFNGMYSDPIGYYKTPLINKIISKQKEAECYASYYANFYNGLITDKVGFIMQKDNKDVGAFVFEIIEGNIFSSMAAVLPQYRSEGLFHDMKVFHQHFCNENNFLTAYTGFRLNNFHTPNLLLKTGYNIYGVEHIFHIPCLFNC